MTKIYQLLIGSKQINDVYHDEDDARADAVQVHLDTGKTVTIWEAEIVPHDRLWSTYWTIIGAARD